MKIFFNVTDRPCNSFMVCNPFLIDIYETNGVLCIELKGHTLYINWNLKECLDAMSLIMDHERLEFDVRDDCISWDEPEF